MRFTTRNDAKNLETLAERVAGPNADPARREAVARRIRELNPHLGDLEQFPSGAPILLPDDGDESPEQLDPDPRIAHALRVAEEATKAAQETIRVSFERAEEKAKQKEQELRRQSEAATDAQLIERLDQDIKRLREENTDRKVNLDRITGTLDKTVAKVAKLKERKRA